MSKIKRLDQLENENSLYRVSGVFDKSQICHIIDAGWGEYEFVATLLPLWQDIVIVDALQLLDNLCSGSVTIMCLQRGEAGDMHIPQ